VKYLGHDADSKRSGASAVQGAAHETHRMSDPLRFKSCRSFWYGLLLMGFDLSLITPNSARLMEVTPYQRRAVAAPGRI
jgi:hypothetical protein